jgi:hypothetical protein
MVFQISAFAESEVVHLCQRLLMYRQRGLKVSGEQQRKLTSNNKRTTLAKKCSVSLYLRNKMVQSITQQNADAIHEI